ncbi:MAG: AGE family epimerase/isomerase [Rikenellaceae bacterium]
MNKENYAYLEQCKAQYLGDLDSQIFDFWLKYGYDYKNGGVYTCLDRDGALMDTTKSVWFQGRFAYICAYAYNNVRRDEKWLEVAKSTIDFIEQHCFDTDGHMFFEVTAEGAPIRRRRYVFSECFAAIAMSEYAVASGDSTYAQKALDLFFSVKKMLATPGFLPAKSMVESVGHSIAMILINVAVCLRRSIQDPALDAQIEQSLQDIKTLFYKPEYKAVLECVAPDGSLIDTCAGRTINPGHCIETAWFILEEARHRNWDKELVELAETIFEWSWEWGWDSEYGGIINFKDCKGFPHQDYSQDMKFWWPQCETIISSLYLYVATGKEKFLDYHKTIHEYTYEKFPDREHGEWYGYLHRDGTPAQPAKGNIFKGPFHIPRMMIVSALLCDEILKDKSE